MFSQEVPMSEKLRAILEQEQGLSDEERAELKVMRMQAGRKKGLALHFEKGQQLPEMNGFVLYVKSVSAKTMTLTIEAPE
jgi:hypothetical protein